MQMAGPHPQLLMQQLWVGAQEFVPLTGPQVTMLQVQRRTLGTLRGCPALPARGGAVVTTLHRRAEVWQTSPPSTPEGWGLLRSYVTSMGSPASLGLLDSGARWVPLDPR